jgi:hypothetical protein
MQTCEKCGNEYSKTFKILMNGKEHIFDSFECAISVLAPKCVHCNVQIIGHGLEASDQFYCCANCATNAGVFGLKDHLGEVENQLSE